MVFLKTLPPFPITELQGTNGSCLICRRHSSQPIHCCLSRKALFRILKSFNPFPLSIAGLPRYSKVFISVFLQLRLDSKLQFLSFSSPSTYSISFATIVHWNPFSSSLPSQKNKKHSSTENLSSCIVSKIPLHKILHCFFTLLLFLVLEIVTENLLCIKHKDTIAEQRYLKLVTCLLENRM